MRFFLTFGGSRVATDHLSSIIQSHILICGPVVSVDALDATTPSFFLRAGAGTGHSQTPTNYATSSQRTEKWLTLLLSPGYGVFPYENVSQSKIPKLQISLSVVYLK